MDDSPFLIAQFDALRREIELAIKEMAEYLRYSIVSSGAIWAWLLSQHIFDLRSASKVAYWLPTALTLLLGLERWRLLLKIEQIGEFIERIETVCISSENLRWEQQLRISLKKKWLLKNVESFAWFALLAANICGGLVAALSK